MAEQSGAVFLSYASQDAEIARRICEALRADGIEVWFDQSELRGGDVWDAAIRRQIKSCTLFIALISHNTRAREEGYFRLEWKLAVDRSHLMSASKAFIVPIVIDDTREDEHVPEKFHEVQWTRLPDGELPRTVVARIKQLLSPTEVAAPAQWPTLGADAAGSSTSKSPKHRPRRVSILLLGLLALVAAGYFAMHVSAPFFRQHGAVSVADSAIPERSIAVLPFINMSPDKEQEYFADGLTDEMIEMLGQVPELRVPARTSSFYFKGKNETVGYIAQQLKVAHLLEGSVRKNGTHLRITAQLVRADNGYQLWSQTYDRENSDIFSVQDDIAKAVVGALKLKLGAAVRAIGARGTNNTDAYNLYLLGRSLYRRESIDGYHDAVDAYRQAIAIDPNYAAAYAQLALAYAWIGDFTGDNIEIDNAARQVEKAISLAPDDAIGYMVRSFIRSSWLWDWSGAKADIDKALQLDPTNSQVEHQNARLLDSLGRMRDAFNAQKRATELDPLSNQAWENLGVYYTELGSYVDADAAFSRGLELEPTSVFARNHVGVLRLLQARAPEALLMFQQVTQDAYRLQGTAMAEYALGHIKQSQQALDQLIAKHADEAAFQIAESFAWVGQKNQAFEWLERSYQQRDGGLSFVKNDVLLKSVRADSRFKALLRKMKLPEESPAS